MFLHKYDCNILSDSQWRSELYCRSRKLFQGDYSLYICHRNIKPYSCQSSVEKWIILQEQFHKHRFSIRYSFKDTQTCRP